MVALFTKSCSTIIKQATGIDLTLLYWLRGFDFHCLKAQYSRPREVRLARIYTK